MRVGGFPPQKFDCYTVFVHSDSLDCCIWELEGVDGEGHMATEDKSYLNICLEHALQEKG